MATFLLALILATNQYPEPMGYVNDFAGVISPEYKTKLTNLITEVEKKTTAEIAIAVVKTTKPEAVDMYAVNLFTKWGIGKKGKDNGVLILVAVDDRKDWIETGYGVEGVLPDAFCGEVHRKFLVPYFRKGEFGKGLWLATLAIAKQLGKEYGVEISGTERVPELSTSGRGSPCGPLIGLLFLFFFLPLLFRTGFFGLIPLLFIGSRGYWTRGTFGGQGGFSGGFGGFGGGSCGGGGAGGGW